MPGPDEYRSIELEAAAATAVARAPTALGNLLKFGVPAGALVLAAWMISSSFRAGPKNMTAPDTEEFRTTQFPAPSLDTPRPSSSQGTIFIPPAPP
ncbi:MAG: conjugal transfer protein, partial [Hyphomicrobiales bacterium]